MMGKKEMQEAIAKLTPLKIHPRDALPNRYKLERAHTLYEDLLGPDRAQLESLIEQFEQVLEEQNLEGISQVGDTLEYFMNLKEPRL